ncbi:hypothetical protein F4775DRAFT_597812 [Biscogniauxia sp. FL1348]|nr:hypothetical protein F4775DRAFT_597812 [Biscogniauxia sp. FL1348]
MSLLLSLPTELVTQIVMQFQPGPGNKTLRALACTSRSLRCITERHLYSSAAFRTPGRFHIFHHALKARPQLRTYVRELALPWSTRLFNYDTDFEPLDLRRLPKLTSFLCESPFCNQHCETYIRSLSRVNKGWSRVVEKLLESFTEASLLTNPGPGGERPLKNLRHLTLHWNDGADIRLWEGTPLCPVFLLPTLDSLEISCIDIRPEDGAAEVDNDCLSRHSRQTNLKSLTITRCYIATGHLHAILSFPRALESFSFMQPLSLGLDDNGPPLSGHNMDAFNAAIAQHSASLRRLELRVEPRLHERGFSRAPGPPPAPRLSLDLSEFRRLEQLHLAPHHSAGPREDTWALVGPLPPALTLLRLSDIWPHDGRQDEVRYVFGRLRIREFIADAARRGVAFELEVGFMRKAVDDPPLPPFVQDLMLLFPCEEKNENEDWNPADQLQEAKEMDKGPRHRLRYLELQGTSYIQPYLCDEVRPIYKLCYDSWRPGGYVEKHERTDDIYLDLGGAGNRYSYRDYLPPVSVRDSFY